MLEGGLSNVRKVSTVKSCCSSSFSGFLDKDQSTSKACKLIREAGSNGAKLIVFPEGFIPTHPVWYHFHAGTGSIATKLSMELFKNSVTIPGPEVNELCKAARDAKAYVVMGVCEKLSNTIGTMYNTQIFIGPDGRYLGKHQKSCLPLVSVLFTRVAMGTLLRCLTQNLVP